VKRRIDFKRVHRYIRGGVEPERIVYPLVCDHVWQDYKPSWYRCGRCKWVTRT